MEQGEVYGRRRGYGSDGEKKKRERGRESERCGGITAERRGGKS